MSAAICRRWWRLAAAVLGGVFMVLNGCEPLPKLEPLPEWVPATIPTTSSPPATETTTTTSPTTTSTLFFEGRYRFIDEPVDGARLYWDLRTMRGDEAGGVKVWILATHEAEQLREQIELGLDCRGTRVKLLQRLVQNAEGIVTSTENFEFSYTQRFADPVPGSLGEWALGSFCVAQ